MTIKRTVTCLDSGEQAVMANPSRITGPFNPKWTEFWLEQTEVLYEAMKN